MTDLEPTHEKLLALIARAEETAMPDIPELDGSSVERLAAKTGEGYTRTRYHLDQLEAERMIACAFGKCSLTPQGRAYVVENDLEKKMTGDTSRAGEKKGAGG